MSETSFYPQLLKNNIRLVLQYSLNALIPLLAVPHIIQIIGLTEFGKLSFVLAIASYLMIVVQYVFHFTGPSTLAASDEYGHKQVLVEVILAKAALLISVYFVLISAFLLLHVLRGVELYQVLSLLALPLAGFLNSGWYLQYINRFSVMVWGSALGAITSLSLAFGVLRGQSEHKLEWASLALICAPLVASLTSFSVAIWAVAGSKLITSPRPLNLIKDGRTLFYSQLVSAGYTGSGVLVIGSLAGSTAAGAYAVLERITNVLIAGLQLIHTAAYPSLARAYRQHPAQYLKTIKFILAVHSFSVAIIAIFVFVRFDFISTALFPGNLELAFNLLPIALIWIWISIFGPIITGFFVVSGQQVATLKLNARILITSFIIGIPGTYAFGAAGWLASLLFSQFWVFWNCITAWRNEVERHK
jgi:PST family polysaccharide transporter